MLATVLMLELVVAMELATVLTLELAVAMAVAKLAVAEVELAGRALPRQSWPGPALARLGVALAFANVVGARHGNRRLLQPQA